LLLPPNPVSRGYRGGDRLRRFRGQPLRGDDDRWPEDWVGSTSEARNPDPDGHVQGPSMVMRHDGATAPLADVVAAFPTQMLGAPLAGGAPATGFLVKLIALGGMGPVHVHPDDGFARRYLGRPHGKAEAWIILDRSPSAAPWAGIGLQPGVDRAAVRNAIDERATSRLHGMLHRTDIAAGDAWFVRPSVPHALGPDVFFIEVQQPADLSVVLEPWTVGADEEGATMGLGWDTALGALDVETVDRDTALSEARQTPELIDEVGASRVWGLMGPAARSFFDVQRFEVVDVVPVAAGRFGVCIVTGGAGHLEGDWGRLEVRAGDTFALPAAATCRFIAGEESMTIHRCLGPEA
jgi:mannose-6-phosphate isomerase